LVGTMSGGSPSSATAARSSTGDVAATSTCRGVASFDDTGPWKPQSYLGRHVAMPKERGLRSSGCTFCGACVLVCPTGALTAEGAKGSAWLATRRERTTVNPAMLPPEERLAFTPAAVASVPPGEGVLRLYSATGEVLQISGVLDMRSALEEALSGPLAAEAVAFVYDAEHMYTQREAELLAHHLQAHGSMPRGNDILGDLLGDEEDDLF
jgi:ferredoxin